ncbi:MAG: right-handed parallel beta-helix repeat-containing protein [Ignavibacteria bacterium]|nr:right-handed parallel beta-helix repeat-containing protein [Ignavibacteria bacterium]
MKLLFLLLISYSQLSLIASAQVHLGKGFTYPNIESAATAGAILPGDTVYLHAGSYYGYQGVSKLKGTANRWITITRYQQDAIDIAGTWQFMSCEYIKFLNLNFQGNTQYPGRLFSVDNSGSCTTQSKYIVVDSCRFTNMTKGEEVVAFKFGGVDSFEVTNCLFKDIPACEAMDYNVCRVGIIRGNRFENCLSGGHIKGGASDILMERNIFINASQAPWVAFELGGDTGAQFYCPEDKFEVKNLRFYSNIIIGGYRGISLSSAVDCKIINNTFYNCGQATLRFLTTSALYPMLSGNRIENNIFAFGSSAYFNGGIQPSTATTFDKNIYYSISSPVFNGPYWDTPELDAIKDKNPTNVGSGTPMFTNEAPFDFHLAEGSPAIGEGLDVSEPMVDYEGKPFLTSGRSIGALEYNSVVGVSESDDLSSRLHPNPAGDYIDLPEMQHPHKLIIYNTLGYKVLEAMGDGRRIDLRTLPQGVYLLVADGVALRFVKM